MSATFTFQRDDELYVYVRGRLVMKRWLGTGVSATYHVAPTGVRWSVPQSTIPTPETNG